MTPSNETIGKAVKRIRKKKKISQEALGAFLGLHQTAICRIERGIQSLAANELYALSRFFNVRMGSFFR